LLSQAFLIDGASPFGWNDFAVCVPTMKTLHVAAVRMGVVAGILLGLVCYPAYLYGDRRDVRALMDTRSIGQALQTYKVNNGHFPQSLHVLTERQPDGNAALLKPSALRDPWGQPYHFDPGQLHPETGAPLVWSDGEPGDPDGKITNWQEELKLKQSFWQKPGIQALWMVLVIVFVVVLVYVRCRYFAEDTGLRSIREWARFGIDALIVTLICLLVVGLLRYLWVPTVLD
jgi:hypothetical protein